MKRSFLPKRASREPSSFDNFTQTRSKVFNVCVLERGTRDISTRSTQSTPIKVKKCTCSRKKKEEEKKVASSFLCFFLLFLLDFMIWCGCARRTIRSKTNKTIQTIQYFFLLFLFLFDRFALFHLFHLRRVCCCYCVVLLGRNDSFYALDDFSSLGRTALVGWRFDFSRAQLFG